MAEVSVELRERLQNDRDFKDRFMNEILLQIASKSDLIDDQGNFRDPGANMRQSATDARIAGRPVFHYFGLSKEQIDRMGLSDEDKAELQNYMNLDSDPNDVGDPTAEAEGSVFLRAHPGASMWTPPAPVDPALASVQNPSGLQAAATAATPQAVSRLAVVTAEGTADAGPFERERLLAESREAIANETKEPEADEETQKQQSGAMNSESTETEPAKPSTKNPAKA